VVKLVVIKLWGVKTMIAKYPCQKVRDEDTGEIEEGEYTYRGHLIRRDDSISSGYWGRWSVGRRTSGFKTDTLASAKAEVDRRVVARESS
jgi:hypothetical protein